MSSATLGQEEHGVLAIPDEYELPEQAFYMAMREFLTDRLAPAVRDSYEELETANIGQSSKDRREIRDRMLEEPSFLNWSTLRRGTQELMWAAIDRSIDRQATLIEDRVDELARKNGVPSEYRVAFAEYLDGFEIHCMPGGYGPDGDTWRAGALYDRGVFVYTMGQLGPRNDNLSRSIIRYLAENQEISEPTKILDLGCTVGHRTLPYAEYYPNAEVIGLDIGLPAVRYAAARADELGISNVRFLQGDARHTGLPTEMADLVLSHILLHEVPVEIGLEILAESWRLVAPGGIVIHADYGQYDGQDSFREFMLDWDTVGNNEPYWSGFRQQSLENMAVKAGIPGQAVEIVKVEAARRLQTGARRGKAGSLTLLTFRKPVASMTADD